MQPPTLSIAGRALSETGGLWRTASACQGLSNATARTDQRPCRVRSSLDLIWADYVVSRLGTAPSITQFQIPIRKYPGGYPDGNRSEPHDTPCRLRWLTA